MSFYFIDSSALSKRYGNEIGTNWILNLVAPSAGHQIIIAQITPLEVVSTLARKKREANISERKLKANIFHLERHIKRYYFTVEFNPYVETIAKQLIIAYPLRAADAIQLASAVTIHRRMGSPKSGGLVFVSADRQLLNAAIAEGLAVDNPILHP